MSDAEHKNQLAIGETKDGHKELHEMTDGSFRVTVFTMTEQGDTWDYEDYRTKEEAHDIFLRVYRYDDLATLAE